MINAMTWLESLNCPVVRRVKHTDIVEDYDFSTLHGAGILWETDQPQL